MMPQRRQSALYPDNLLRAAAHPDPYPYYAALLAHGPLHRAAGIGMWAALGAGAVTAVLENPLCRVRPAAETVPPAIAGSSAGALFGDLVRMNDGARHAMMKPAVSGLVSTFEPGAIAALARQAAAACLAETGCDRKGIDQFLRAYPGRAMAQAIGLPAAAAPEAARLIGDFVRCLSPLSDAAEIECSKAAATRLLALLDEQVERGAPGGLPMLVERLRSLGLDQRAAALANLLGLMSQAYDATAGLIGNTLLALARDPVLRRRTAGDDALLARVVQEVLRHDPPVHNTRRHLAEDAIIAGQAMKAGDTILVVLAAANRDPARHSRPHVFDPDRADQRSFTFGHGAHACPGERIATTLAVIGLQALMAQGAAVEDLAEPARYAPSVNGRIPIFHGARA